MSPDHAPPADWQSPHWGTVGGATPVPGRLGNSVQEMQPVGKRPGSLSRTRWPTAIRQLFAAILDLPKGKTGSASRIDQRDGRRPPLGQWQLGRCGYRSRADSCAGPRLETAQQPRLRQTHSGEDRGCELRRESADNVPGPRELHIAVTTVHQEQHFSATTADGVQVGDSPCRDRRICCSPIDPHDDRGPRAPPQCSKPSRGPPSGRERWARRRGRLLREWAIVFRKL